jgi:hypothetical protein
MAWVKWKERMSDLPEKPLPHLTAHPCLVCNACDTKARIRALRDGQAQQVRIALPLSLDLRLRLAAAGDA